MTDVLLDAAAWKDVEAGTEALLDQWLVREGEAVRAGQPLARVVAAVFDTYLRNSSVRHSIAV